MKKLYAFLISFLCLQALTAQTLYWVGPNNGNFGTAANWSATSGGAGGAGVPGATNDIIINSNALVNLNLANPVIHSLLVTNNSVVTLYTSAGSLLTVTSSSPTTPALKIDAGSTLIDNTTQDVTFDFIFDTSSIGQIDGNWEFEGQLAPIIGGGAGFTAMNSGMVNITGTVTFKENSNNIDATPSTVTFAAGSFYVLNKDEDADVPDVTYHATSTVSVIGSVNFLPNFNGTAPSYGNVVFNLPGLLVGESLGFPNGTTIKGNLQFLNTNNQTLRILSNIGTPTLTVNTLMISGSNARVAEANEDNHGSPSPGTSYRLQLTNYVQTAGAFSLQEDNNVTGTTTLAVAGNVNQSGGVFGVNSTATSSATDLFVLEMNGSTAQAVSVLNSAQSKLTLKMNSGAGGSVALQNALQVGKLNLASGVLTTTTPANALAVLTVSDPDPVNAVRNGSAASYVNGALRRTTNAASEYIFPTGKSGMYHAISVVPATTTGSVFESEYFSTAYPDGSVLPPLAGVSDREYWIVNRPAGTDNAAVRIALNRADPRATSSHTIVVAKYNGTDWQSEGNTGPAVPGDASTGTVTSFQQTSFSPFTLGIEGAAALPIHLLSFDAKKQSGGARLDWKAEELPASFEILKSDDGSSYHSIGSVKVIAGVNSYNFLDPSLWKGVNYYRLKSIERDGNVSFSKVVALINKENGVEITSMAPNLVVSTSKLNISSAHGGRMELVITDVMGRIWRRLGVSVSPGNDEVNLNLSDLAAGTYQVTGYMNGEKTKTIRFIKK